jgi:hypothetical protein
MPAPADMVSVYWSTLHGSIVYTVPTTRKFVLTDVQVYTDGGLPCDLGPISHGQLDARMHFTRDVRTFHSSLGLVFREGTAIGIRNTNGPPALVQGLLVGYLVAP